MTLPVTLVFTFRCHCGFHADYSADSLLQFAERVVGFVVPCPHCTNPMRSRLPPPTRVLRASRPIPDDSGAASEPSPTPMPVGAVVIKSGDFDEPR